MRGASSRKQLLLRGIAWFSCDPLVFTRVASSCKNGAIACADLSYMKAVQFAIQRAVQGETVCVLPNGAVHGASTYTAFVRYQFGVRSLGSRRFNSYLLRPKALRYVFRHWHGVFYHDRWYFWSLRGPGVVAKRCQYCRVFHSFSYYGHTTHKWKRFCGEHMLRVWKFARASLLSRRDLVRLAVVRYARAIE